MKLIIMMNGHPLAGKSTAAKNIREVLKSNGLKAEIVKSVHTRHKKSGNLFSKNFIDEDIKEIRTEKDEAYSKLCDIAKKHLQEGIIPILDATFHKKYRRDWVYKLADETKAELIIVWIEYKDLNNIKLMLKERRENHDTGDNILSRFTQYKTMVKQTDDIKDKEINKGDYIKMIRFNRKNRMFHFYKCNQEGSIIRLIVRALRGVL